MKVFNKIIDKLVSLLKESNEIVIFRQYIHHQYTVMNMKFTEILVDTKKSILLLQQSFNATTNIEEKVKYISEDIKTIFTINESIENKSVIILDNIKVNTSNIQEDITSLNKKIEDNSENNKSISAYIAKQNNTLYDKMLSLNTELIAYLEDKYIVQEGIRETERKVIKEVGVPYYNNYDTILKAISKYGIDSIENNSVDNDILIKISEIVGAINAYNKTTDVALKNLILETLNNWHEGLPTPEIYKQRFR